MRLGIDLGGTKTEIIAINDNNGEEVFRHRVPSPQHDYKGTIETIKELVALTEDKVGKTYSLGVGIPGSVSSVTGKVKNANSTWLNGQPLDKDLQDALSRPVKVENDANCLAVSEATDGAAAGQKTVFAVIIGTGCGAGIAVEGKPIMGINGIGGEWGHNPLPLPKVYTEDKDILHRVFDKGLKDPTAIINPTYAHKPHPTYFTDNPDLNEYPGMQCYCGKRGCLETWISGTGMSNDYQRVTGEKKTAKDIVNDALNGNQTAHATLERYTDRLARALSTVVNILDPDMIVLGGGMGNIDYLYEQVPVLWDHYIFSDTIATKLARPVHGDSSGVRGAAWL